MDKKTKKVFQQAMQDRTPIYLSADALDISFQTKIIKIADNHLVLKNTITPEYIKTFMSSTHYFFQVSMLRHQCDKIKSDGAHIIYPISEQSLIKDERQSERFSFTAAENVVCEILNPYDQVTRITKQILDMSAYGLSFQTTYASNLIQAGAHLDEIRVMIDGEPYKITSGEIVYQRKLMNLRGQIRIQAGVKFE
ncbi:MAG: hypothetical protein R3B45_12645 [Bdellovibrionota bacterium]